MTLRERGQVKSWVTINQNQNHHCGTGLSKTQLLISEAVPVSTYNHASRAGPPAPIVIEKLMPKVEEQQDGDSTRSSISFSALSEERLLAAVRLAKRDLRRKRQESLINSPIRSQQPETSQLNISIDDKPQRIDTNKERAKATLVKEEMTRSGAKVLVYTPQKLSVPAWPKQDQSPPTRDPGPGQSSNSQEPKLSQEICRLQKELAIYVQRIEQLPKRGGRLEEPLEPDEQRRVEVRRQEQAARSARIIYVLQQQVKEIQEDIEKLRSQKIRHTKKSRAMDRLAAAHRGAVRAMHIFTNQLSGPSEGRVPSHYKELGQLIRQLSLCSAKVEVGQGSAVPETALDILQKLETMDSALSKQESPHRRRGRARSSSPARRRFPHHSTSPPRAARRPATRGLRGPHRAAGPKRSLAGGRRVAQPPRSNQPPLLDRSQVLRAGLESLVQQRELKEGGQKPGYQVRDAGFQQPTVSSRLRVNQLPQREPSVPWIPTSPHSPPRQRLPHRGPEPRCLFSPGGKPPSLSPSPAQQEQLEQQEQRELKEARQVTSGPGLSFDSRIQAQSEALRQAWLDKMTMQRLRELDRLSKEAVERIQRLRSDVDSTQWVRGEDQEDRERLKPALCQAQAAENTEQVSEALLEELLDEAARATWTAETDRLTKGLAQGRLQAPTVESMLLRMEEMERDQEAVRRRFATTSHTDPHDWDREETGTQQPSPGSRPAPSQPIRFTRPSLRHPSRADIILEELVETSHTLLSEASLPEQGRPEDVVASSPLPIPEGIWKGTRVCVPASMLGSILQYRENHEAYLRLVAHEAVGSFNPWAIADSLAEELMSEALADVAAEFQDVCEEYAEAVFTSEFLQPIHSPPAPLPLLDSQ